MIPVKKNFVSSKVIRERDSNRAVNLPSLMRAQANWFRFIKSEYTTEEASQSAIENGFENKSGRTNSSPQKHDSKIDLFAVHLASLPSQAQNPHSSWL